MENAVAMNNGRQEFIITWFIENYSYCLHNNGEKLISAELTPDGFEGTTWYLHLYPRGHEDQNRSNVSLFLSRYISDNGPEFFPLKYELSILAPDGSVLLSKELLDTFGKGTGFGLSEFVQIDEILLRREVFLPQDILNVSCRMWRDDLNVQSVIHMSTVTHIEIEHLSYLHVVEGFSALKPKKKNTVQIRSPSNGVSLTSSLYFDESCCGKVMVEIESFCDDDILSRCKLSLLDASGEITVCSRTDNRFDATRGNIKKLSFSKTDILKRKNEYLPDDKLSLLCDCTFNTRNDFKKIARTLYQLPSVAVHYVNNNDQNKDTYNVAEKLSACSSVMDDFKTIYDDPFLTDVELKTKTKSFRAHKVLLCARSAVFKAMLTVDMKEKYTDCIRIDDLENDTVQQLLLFLYTDDLENLQWESAIKLYYAGDKYAMERLKVLCSTFLVNNVRTSNASDLLLLADTHNDSDLRKFMENFILQHEEEVFSSDEWERLAEINSQLVTKIMLLKYKRKKGGEEER